MEKKYNVTRKGFDNLLSLRHFIGNLRAEQFKFSVWISDYELDKEKNICGTVCCAGGWLPAVMPETFEWRLKNKQFESFIDGRWEYDTAEIPPFLARKESDEPSDTLLEIAIGMEIPYELSDQLFFSIGGDSEGPDPDDPMNILSNYIKAFDKVLEEIQIVEPEKVIDHVISEVSVHQVEVNAVPADAGVLD